MRHLVKQIAYLPIIKQIQFIRDILTNDPIIMSILQHPYTQKLEAYLGAGSIMQRIWNKILNNNITYGVSDYDIVYFDSDISEEKQTMVQNIYTRLFPKINIECTNQARVHLWYKSYFGYTIDPLTSVEHAVTTWPITANAIAIRWKNESLEIIAPFGFFDLLSLTLRPNKQLINQDVYERKVRKWIKKWPQLEIVPW